MKPPDSYGPLRRRHRKPKPAPAPAPVSPPYGTREQAGPFASCLMLGSNPDVWDQAMTLPCQSVAVVTGTPPARFTGKQVVLWFPPERTKFVPTTPTSWAGVVYQAESQAEWDSIADVAAEAVKVLPTGIVANWWGYGRYPANVVALPEVYANEQAVDYGVFGFYMQQGAAAVVPCCGVYPAKMPDQQAADLYRALAGRGLPGIAAYAGEDPVTDACMAALRQLWR